MLEIPNLSRSTKKKGRDVQKSRKGSNEKGRNGERGRGGREKRRERKGEGKREGEERKETGAKTFWLECTKRVGNGIIPKGVNEEIRS